MRRTYQYLAAAVLCGGLTLAGWTQSFGKLEVEVLRGDNDEPLRGVKVVVADKAGTFRSAEVTTDDTGKVLLDQLPPGEYVIEMSHPQWGGESASIKIEEDRTTRFRTALEAGEEPSFTVRVKREPSPFETAEAATATRSREFIDTQIADRSLQGVLATAPGLQRNSMGQVHARGEHKSVSFALDGVEVPVPLASSTTPPLDPDFLNSLSLRTGALTGAQGGQSGVIVDADTIVPDRPFFEYRTRAGTQGTWENLVRAGGATDNQDFTIFVGAKTFRTDMQFEAPHPEEQTLNNQGVGRSYLLRMTGKTDMDQFGATVSYTGNDFDLPQTPGNYAAGVRQSQQDVAVLGLLSWQRKVDEDTDLNMSLSYLRNRQRVRNNGIFTPWTSVDPGLSEELADEGFPADPENPGSPYLPNTDLVVQQIQPRMELVHRMGSRNEIRGGLNADFVSSRQRVNLQDPGGGGGLPGGGPNFLADLSRTGFIGGVYFSHTLPLNDELTLNWGLRGDVFDNGINVRTGQISPLLNLSYAFNERNRLRFSYNQSFQPPPLELDVSGQTMVLPQRITSYELAYDTQLNDTLSGRLALVRKDFRDQIDTGLLVANSNIPLFAPLNFPEARYQGVELSLNTRNPLGWNGFLAGTLSEARPLAPNPFTGEQPEYNDHDQRVQLTAGVSYKWENGFSAAVDCFYGSGYPQVALGLYNQVGISPFGYSGDRVPRFLTNLSLNYFPPRLSEDGPEIGAGLQILNLFDQRPLLNFLSEFSGTRFVQQRRILFNAQVRF